MTPTADDIEAYVRSLARAELGVEPSDAEVARGCAALAACLLEEASAGYLRLKPMKAGPPKHREGGL